MIDALLMLLALLGLACAITVLVCFIMIVVKMFQNDRATLGIVCIALALCAVIGQVASFFAPDNYLLAAMALGSPVATLTALVVGWMNVRKWRIRRTMIAFTASYGGLFAMWAIATAVLVAAYAMGGATGYR